MESHRRLSDFSSNGGRQHLVDRPRRRPETTARNDDATRPAKKAAKCVRSVVYGLAPRRKAKFEAADSEQRCRPDRRLDRRGSHEAVAAPVRQTKKTKKTIAICMKSGSPNQENQKTVGNMCHSDGHDAYFLCFFGFLGLVNHFSYILQWLSWFFWFSSRRSLTKACADISDQPLTTRATAPDDARVGPRRRARWPRTTRETAPDDARDSP